MEVVELQHGSHGPSVQPYLTWLLPCAPPFGVGPNFLHHINLGTGGGRREVCGCRGTGGIEGRRKERGEGEEREIEWRK